jgi:hypothetical protein
LGLHHLSPISWRQKEKELLHTRKWEITSIYKNRRNPKDPKQNPPRNKESMCVCVCVCVWERERERRRRRRKANKIGKKVLTKVFVWNWIWRTLQYPFSAPNKTTPLP